MNRFIFPVLLAASVAVCWAFPKFWYTRTVRGQKYVWLNEQTQIPGWTYRDAPVSDSAERLLVADRVVHGDFTNRTGVTVRVLSAKRYRESGNEIGLFVHTPDRCWTQGGWKIDPAAPEFLDLDVHGIPMRFERRIFASGEHRELVYFAGLIGGQPLPFRLDHNLSVALRYQMRSLRGDGGAGLRASDSKLWRRVWDAFASRRPLLGPKQFVRISTQVRSEDGAEGDQVLRAFLPAWLEPVGYQHEMQWWRERSEGRGQRSEVRGQKSEVSLPRRSPAKRDEGRKSEGGRAEGSPSQ